MTKGELADLFKETSGLSGAKAKEVMEMVFGGMAGKLKNGEEVVLPFIGKISVKERAARKGHNPKTGQSIDIPATKVLKLSMCKDMKESLK